MSESPYAIGDQVSAAGLNAAICPIGTILSWAKSISGMPALEDGWVQCDGQTLSDADSPINGEVIPDLNSTNRFMRGNTTSGGTGGLGTVTLSEAEMPSHTHLSAASSYSEFGDPGFGVIDDGNMSQSSTGSKGSDTAHENKPPYYDVVWIMRVK